jgi:hypothetical protein
MCARGHPLRLRMSCKHAQARHSAAAPQLLQLRGTAVQLEGRAPASWSSLPPVYGLTVEKEVPSKGFCVNFAAGRCAMQLVHGHSMHSRGQRTLSIATAGGSAPCLLPHQRFG